MEQLRKNEILTEISAKQRTNKGHVQEREKKKSMFNARHSAADTRIQNNYRSTQEQLQTHTKNPNDSNKSVSGLKDNIAVCSGNKFKLDMFFVCARWFCCCCCCLSLHIISIRHYKNVSAKSKVKHLDGQKATGTRGTGFVC